MIAIAFIAALFCNGIYISMRSGMILGWLWQWSELNLPEWMKKPVSHCVYCMASVWGGPVVVALTWWSGYPIWYVPIILPMVVYLNGLLNAILSNVEEVN